MSHRPIRTGAIFCVLIDPEHDIAGFVLDWIRALAARLDRLEVIALEVVDEAGANLPENVRVHTLGKEKGYGRARILLNSQLALAKVLPGADFLLCHMMPVYALASALQCRFRRKPLLLWYTHQHLDLKLRLAVRAADLVLTAVDESMRVDTPKKRVLGHGIDTDRFMPGPVREPGGPLRVVSVGRLSPVKRLEALVEAAENLAAHGRLEDFRFTLVGQPSNQEQEKYTRGIRDRIDSLGFGEAFEFTGTIPFARVAESYHRADLFISMQEQRGLDKAVLEAMASGLPVIVANSSFEPLLGEEARRMLYPAREPGGLAERLLEMAELTPAERRGMGLVLREGVVNEHGLGSLMDRIIALAGEVKRS